MSTPSTREPSGSRTFNVLFLCTGNSARSIIAESILRSVGGARFNAFSAGSHPTGTVNPLAVEVLRDTHMPVDGLRSKSWDEFAQPGAPELDFIITVCDNAAGEACPIWPGKPVTAHWGVPDPASVEGDEASKRAAFLEAATALRRRIELFLALPIAKLDARAIKAEMRDIGGQ